MIIFNYTTRITHTLTFPLNTIWIMLRCFQCLMCQQVPEKLWKKFVGIDAMEFFTKQETIIMLLYPGIKNGFEICTY